MKKITCFVSVLALTFAVSLSSCKKSADTTPAATTTLYDRLGKVDNIRKVVDTFINNVVADNVINGKFSSTVSSTDKDAQGNNLRVRALKINLVDQVCAATGGPCTYNGLTMQQAHKGMGITEAQFNALVGDLSKALDANGAAAADRDALLGALAPMKTDIVNQ